MKKIIFAAFFLTAVLFNYTFAQPFHGKGNPDRQCMEELNLNDAQVKQFNNFQYDHQQKVIDLRAEMKKNLLEMKKMMTDNNVDENKLRELTKTNSDIKEQIQLSRLDMWLSIHKILNADQQKIWTDHFAGMGEGRHFGKKCGRHDRRGRFNNDNSDRPMLRKKMQYKMDIEN